MAIPVYLEVFSSNSMNKKGQTSHYLPLMSSCGDPWTSPTRTSPHSGLPKRFYCPFVQFPNLCTRYAFHHRCANDVDCGWYLRRVPQPTSPNSSLYSHHLHALNVNVAAVVALALAMSAYAAPSLPNPAAPAPS